MVSLRTEEKRTAVLYDLMGIGSKLHAFGLIRIHSESLLENNQTLTVENGEPYHVSSVGDRSETEFDQMVLVVVHGGWNSGF
jgi:hypothetical protein